MPCGLGRNAQPPPPPTNRRPNSADLADLFCRFVGFLDVTDLFCRFVGFLGFCRFILPICSNSAADLWGGCADLFGFLGFWDSRFGGVTLRCASFTLGHWIIHVLSYLAGEWPVLGGAPG